MKTKFKISNQILSLLMALVMVVSMLPMSSFTASAAAADDLTVLIDTGTSVTLKDTDADGYYEIGNADALYAFAAAVNGGNTAINGKLMEDITVNTGVLNSDGTLNGDGSTFRAWTPIGNDTNKYAGTFDGNGKTVSGIYINGTSNYQGLFGYVQNGTVKNVTVLDSYIKGNKYVGGVVGHNYYGGTVQNCYNSGAVSGTNKYDGYVGGVVGQNNYGGTVQNCHNSGTVSGTGILVGGVVGDNYDGFVQNCYNTGAVSGSRYVGGVVGQSTSDAIVQNCYNTGAVSGTGKVGGVVGDDNSSTVANCYFLQTTDINAGLNGIGSSGIFDGSNEGVAPMTADQFKSGEVAYLLNAGQNSTVWYQTLGENGDAAPVLTPIYDAADATKITNIVYAGTPCTGLFFNEANTTAEHSFANSICTVCGAIAPIEKNANGVYEIYVPEHLVEFAQIVNGTHKTIQQDKAANAILKDNIDMNGIPWTPICSTGLYYNTTNYTDKGYEGTFDGNGHVIKNLSVTAIANQTWTYGLFGTMTGTVKNLGIEGFTYNHNGATDMRVGAIVGQNLGGTIENCYVVKATITPGTNVAGGITGCNYAGTIKNCYVADSTVLASASRYGYIAGDNRADTAGDRVGTINNCYTDGDRLVGSYTGTETNSKYGVNYKYFTNGGLVWYLNGQSADGIWKQGETHPNFTGTAVTQSLLSSHTQPKLENGAYQIATESELRWFAEYVNFTDASVSAVLTDNIKMEGTDWIPIGMYGMPFTGTFDGAEKSITGFKMNITGSGYHGLFGVIQDATVKNFSINGEVVSELTAAPTEFNYGVIGEAAGSTVVTDVHSSVNFTSKDSYYKNTVAGIIGRNNSTGADFAIERCSFSGVLDLGRAQVDCTGGIIAYVMAGNTAKINNCLFSGKIISTYDGALQIGGMIGYYRLSALTITNCLSIGTITSTDSTLNGMIAGVLRQHTSANTMVTNNYYTEGAQPFGNSEPGDDITDGYGSQTVAGSATAVTTEQLKSGEVAYLLNGSASEGDLVWYQTLTTDNSPAFDGETVYYVVVAGCCEENYVYDYKNTNEPVYSHIYDENGECVCGDLNYFYIGQLGPQIRFGTNEDGSYACTFDIRTRAKILDADFAKFIAKDNDTAEKLITKAGFVYSINPDSFSIDDAKLVAKGEKISGYTDAPVRYIQDAEGYYMFTCIVTNIPSTEIAQTLVSFAYICVEIDGIEYWYFMETQTEADFNNLYTRCIPLACDAYGWESFSAYVDNGDGTHSRTCVVCGEIESGEHTEEYTYTWAEDYTTCTATAVCTGCGSEVTVQTVNAVYAVTTSSTCTVKGTGTYTATFTAEGLMAQTKEVELPLDPDAHTVTTWTQEGITHTGNCDHCGATVTEAHSGGTATCLVGKICEICGFEYDTTKAPDNHVSTEYTYTDNEDGIHTEAHKCCGTVTYEYDESTNTYTVYTAKGLYAWGEAARAVISTGTEDTNNDWYAEYTKDMPNLTLAADITLTGENNWTPLGYVSEDKSTYYSYIGTIDGNGHTITGLNINSTGDLIAFVGSLGPNSEVKNLTFKDATIVGGECVATVVADCGGNVTNCHVTGSSSVSGNNQVAGVIAINTDGIISGCTNAAAVTVNVGDNTWGSGGVVGSNANNGIVMGCFNSGDITASASNGSHLCGGVVGLNNHNASTIIACGNTGNVVSSVKGVGGIAGGNYSVPVYACWTKETTELSNGEVSNKDGVGVDNNNKSVLKACYSFADASAVADAITAMNTAIENYNASAAEGRKCTYKWQAGTDGYPTLVEIDQSPTE